MSDSEFEFSAAMELSSDIFAEDFEVDESEDCYRDSKCDYCNCAFRDCSLCGSNAEG